MIKIVEPSGTLRAEYSSKVVPRRGESIKLPVLGRPRTVINVIHVLDKYTDGETCFDYVELVVSGEYFDAHL